MWLLGHTLTCYQGKDYTSPPLLDNDNFIVEWQVFKRALKQKTKLFMETNKLTKMPALSAVKVHTESTGAYRIFVKFSFFQSEQLQLKDLLATH